MTGVTGLADLVAAGPELRPTYVAADLSGLDESHPEHEASDAEVSAGGWRARVERGSLAIDGDGEASDWWRVAAVAGWRHLDKVGEPVDSDAVTPPR